MISNISFETSHEISVFYVYLELLSCIFFSHVINLLRRLVMAQSAQFSPIARSTPSTEPVRGYSVNICLLKNLPFEEPAAFSRG